MESGLWWGVIALTLAGFIQGALGFGFGITAMALLPLVLPVQQASPLVVLFTLPLVMLTFIMHRRHFQWRDSWLLVVGTCIGIPIGVYLLTAFPGTTLLRLLGGVLFVFSLYELLGRYSTRCRFAFPLWSAALVGFVSGITSGAFNAGGPPLVAYSYAQSWSKERIVALLQAVFLVGAILRMASMLQSGLFTPTVLLLGIWGALPVLIALLLGTALLRRIATENLRQVVFVFIGLIALKYLIWT